MPRRGGGRGRGRVRRGAAAAARPRDERAVDVDVIDLSDDDVKSTRQAKPLNSAGRCAADTCEGRLCDSPVVSTRNLRRLRKRTAASVAATAEVPDVSLSDDEDGEMLPPSRRSKRLQRKLTGKDDLIGSESEDDVFVNREDESQKLVQQRRPKRLRKKLLSEYYSGEVTDDKDTWRSSSDDDDHLPPQRRSKHLQDRVRTRNRESDDDADSDTIDKSQKLVQQRRPKRLRKKLLSEYYNVEVTEDKGTWRSSSDDDDHLPPQRRSKRLRDRVGTRNHEYDDNADSDTIDSKRAILKLLRVCCQCLHLQDQVPLDWLLVHDRLRAQSYIRKNSLPKEVFSDDERKPEWFEVDRAIACRRKFEPHGLCDILDSFKDNEDFEGYEFLVKWKGLDYCDATWESYSTEGVQSAVSMLVERHRNTLKRADCISQMYTDEMIPENVHSAALYDYQLQGLQWIFDNFKTRRSVILAVDEAHRLKKVDCNLASVLKRYSSEFRLLLTGTPLQNNILELFSLLHYIDPDEFSDPKANGLFLPIESGLDLTIDEKIARIHEILKPRMLRRMKSDVLKDSMPIKKWVEVPCALTDSQRDLYINILEKNYSKLNSAIQSGLEVNQRAGEDVFLSLVSASGKLQLLHKLLPKLKGRGNRVLIFSQMTKMLDILEDFLFTLGYKYARIDGQTSLSARQERIKEYNNVESETFIFLMSTRAGGLGIDLPGADRVIIYDPDFNPFMDLQAQSRAHRIGQTRPVVVYQLITKCSVEEKILQKSKQKLAIENMLMNSSKKPSAEELKSILLHGAKTILEKKKINATSIHYDDEAIENLLKLDPSSGEKCSSDDNGYLGSIVSFAHGGEEEGPLSPKVEDLKVFKPATPKVELLGRGRRQRLEVKYSDEFDNEDSDDMYAPEVSSESSSSSSDDETEQEIPEVGSLKPEVASVPDSQLTSSLGYSDGEKENVKLE
ncbi:hypothetical protein ACQ4PT_057446 [Festuca glaucescens]